MQDQHTGAPSGDEQSVLDLRRSPLNTARYDHLMHRFPDYGVPSPKRFSHAVKLFLDDNPHLSQDLEAEHAQHPNDVTMAVVPSSYLVLAMYGDEAIAVLPTLSCTQGAIKELFGRARPDGYGIINFPTGFPDQLVDFILNNNPNERTFNYDYNINTAPMFIAADVQGIISSIAGETPHPDYEFLSPRVSIPTREAVSARRSHH